MFSGAKVQADLRCDNSLMKVMVDRFGEEYSQMVEKADEDVQESE